MKKIITQQTSIVEVFLNEFCNVNGIEEGELKNNLVVTTYPSDNTILVTNVDDIRDVKFGVRVKLKSENKSFSANFDIFGEYLDHKDAYPETTKLLEDINNGGNTRNTEASS